MVKQLGQAMPNHTRNSCMRAARVDAVGDAAWKVRTGELEPRGVGVGNRVALEGDRCPSRSVIHDYSMVSGSPLVPTPPRPVLPLVGEGGRRDGRLPN